MTVKQLAAQLNAIKEELQDKEIVSIASNGMMFEPTIKFALKKGYVIQIDKESVDKVVLSFD